MMMDRWPQWQTPSAGPPRRRGGAVASSERTASGAAGRDASRAALARRRRRDDDDSRRSALLLAGLRARRRDDVLCSRPRRCVASRPRLVARRCESWRTIVFARLPPEAMASRARMRRLRRRAADALPELRRRGRLRGPGRRGRVLQGVPRDGAGRVPGLLHRRRVRHRADSPRYGLPGLRDRRFLLAS